MARGRPGARYYDCRQLLLSDRCTGLDARAEAVASADRLRKRGYWARIVKVSQYNYAVYSLLNERPNEDPCASCCAAVSACGTAACVCFCHDFASGRLVEDSASPGTLYKLSERQATAFTATLVYPIPAHTTVRQFAIGESHRFREPSDQLVRKHDVAWGFPKRSLAS